MYDVMNCTFTILLRTKPDALYYWLGRTGITLYKMWSISVSNTMWWTLPYEYLEPKVVKNILARISVKEGVPFGNAYSDFSKILFFYHELLAQWATLYEGR